MVIQNFVPKEDNQLEIARARFSNVLKRHASLQQRVSRDSDKMVCERLRREFDAAIASRIREILLDGEQWNDGLLATIRERVHMEADRKAMQSDMSLPPGPHIQDNVTYRVGNKVICCLEGARIGIQYETSFAAIEMSMVFIVHVLEIYGEAPFVWQEHTVPFVIPIREAENDFLFSNSMCESLEPRDYNSVRHFTPKLARFIDHVGDLLQAYVDRRQQIQLLKELYGDQLAEIYQSLSYNMVEFVLNKSGCKIVVSIRYADLVSILPTRVKVLAWPMHQKQKTCSTSVDGKEIEGSGVSSAPIHLTFAEEALQTMSLPEACAEMVLNLPQALQKISQQGVPMST